MPKVHLVGYSPSGYEEEFDCPPEKALEYIDRHNVVWLNLLLTGERPGHGATLSLDKPSQKHITSLETVFGIDTLALEDVVKSNQRPKVEDYGEIAFIVARVIPDAHVEQADQLSMFVTKKIVITIVYEPLDFLVDVRQMIYKKTPWLVKGKSDRLAYTILDKAVDSNFPVIERVGRRLDDLEEEVLMRPGRTTMLKVSDIRWELALLRRFLLPMRDAINTLIVGAVPNFTKDVRNHFRDVLDHLMRQLDIIENYKEMDQNLMQLYTSSLNLEMNRIIAVLTIITVILLPLNLIASIYGMNVALPGGVDTGNYSTLAWILAFMVVVVGVIVAVMLRKRWLILR